MQFGITAPRMALKQGAQYMRALRGIKWSQLKSSVSSSRIGKYFSRLTKKDRNILQDYFSINRQKGLGDIAAGTRAEAEAIGKAWVNGLDAKKFPLENGGFGITDGTRSFRLQFKPKDAVWKANFQENVFIEGRKRGIEIKNIHMNITDMPPP